MKGLFNLASLVLLLPAVLAASGNSGPTVVPCSVAVATAGLRLDGSLSDWDSRIAAQPLSWSRSANGTPPDSSAAAFRCLADGQFLYLGIAVSGGPLLFETTPFNEAWRNDAVEVFFSSQSSSSAAHIKTGLIRVSADSTGRPIMEGTGTVTDGTHVTRRFSYPLLWDALGVKSAIIRSLAGYSVELAIPRPVFGSPDGLLQGGLSVNVRVRRSCGQKPCQAVLESSDDPYNTSPTSSELYRPMSFQEPAPGTPASSIAQPDDSLRSLVYQAIQNLDALDAATAVQALQQSTDRRLLPILASSSIAAGQFATAAQALQRLRGPDSSDTLRLWADELAAISYLFQKDTAAAKAEYQDLAGAPNPAFKDIGVAGLIDADLKEDNGESALSAYQAAFAGAVPAGIRSTSRMVTWLRDQNRTSEAIQNLKRFLASSRANDAEKAWGLGQLQSAYVRAGQIDESIAVGWQLQSTAPPGDPSAAAGLAALASAVDARRVASSISSTSFVKAYAEFCTKNPLATDPKRKMVLASVLQIRNRLDEAEAVYQDVIADSMAIEPQRAAAMLASERLQRNRGLLEGAATAGLAIQGTFPKDFAIRYAGWKLLMSSPRTRSDPRAQSVRSTIGEGLVEDLRAAAQVEGSPTSHSARSLLLQFNRENLR